MNENSPKDPGAYQGIYQAFSMDLQKWCKTGQEPRDGDLDLKYYLDLQERRLKTLDLSMELSIKPLGRIIPVRQQAEASALLRDSCFNRFNQSLHCQTVDRSLSFRRENRELLRRDCRSLFYQVILDPDENLSGLQDYPCSCPNCGALSPLGKLQEEGCPYCKTHFLISQLYPKVCNYFFIDAFPRTPGQVRQELKKILPGALILSGIVAAAISLMGLLTKDLHTVFSGICSFLLLLPAGALSMFLWLLVRILWDFGKKGVSSFRMFFGSIRSKDRLDAKFRQWDPSFSYLYFEGKALSLARAVLFHQDLPNFVQYEGPDISSRFASVADAQYRNGIKIRNLQKLDGKIHLTADLYMTLALDKGKSVKLKNRKVRIRMYHDASVPVDPAFSIAAVCCQGCGGSIDARRTRFCPSCGAPYHAARKDWVVTDVET